MFPKKQRIVKKKEIEKALKTPFRTGFNFGQILLFPRKKMIDKLAGSTKLQTKIVQKNQNSNQNTQTSNTNKPESLQNLGENLVTINLEDRKQIQNIKILDKDDKNYNNLLDIIQPKQSKLTQEKIEKEKRNQQNKRKIINTNSENNSKNIKICNQFRVLCIVSKKIHKKANQRNKIRRRFIAIFQELSSQNRLPPNLDLAIIIRTKDILTAKFEDYQKIVPAVSTFWQKLRLQNKI